MLGGSEGTSKFATLDKKHPKKPKDQKVPVSLSLTSCVFGSEKRYQFAASTRMGPNLQQLFIAICDVVKYGSTNVVQGTVPYLGTFLTDLVMLDTAVKDYAE
eukprot:g29414.t1